MYAYMCVHMYVYIYIYILFTLCMCISLSIYIYIYVHVYIMYVCMYVCLFVCLFVCMCLCMYVCMHACMYVYTYVYVYVYVCVYMYIYIYICIHICCSRHLLLGALRVHPTFIRGLYYHFNNLRVNTSLKFDECPMPSSRVRCQDTFFWERSTCIPGYTGVVGRALEIDVEAPNKPCNKTQNGNT